MPTLASELRSKLERVVTDARDAAEAGARAALETLAVHEPKFYPHMSRQQQELRNHLRARARQLGDLQDSSGRLVIDHLAGECAYEHWHRMLFGRFLAENGLLIEPQENIAISLAEAEELAKEDGVDVWVFASRCAQRMLPQIFRPDDPLLQVSFATEHMLKLEGLLASLPQPVFNASDALGWVYQFWQSKKKDEINRSEVKIGADEISAVTQLFTEPYMVAFLLHNTLGAWWAGKKLAAEDAASAKTEDEVRRKLVLPGVGWEYLRFVRGADGKGGPWRPAAGTFDGWPKTAAELKVLDHCCGSGHFLVAGLHHLVPIRMAEEGLSAAEAVDAVLRDNLHGLEIDERCCQIAAFALAVAAWTYPNAGGYRPLPNLHIACTGIGPQSTKEQWLRLAEEAAGRGGMPAKRDLFVAEDSLLSASVKRTLEALYELFSQAPVLGSLINPANLRADLFHAEYKAVAPLLSAVLEAQSTTDETRERAIAAAGMVKAADLLAGEYTLVITNVPYLEQRKQSPELRAFCQTNYSQAKGDLASVFADRSFGLLVRGGSAALVTPQNWLYLTTYGNLRTRLLKTKQWHSVARLGPGAFSTITGHVVQPVLIILTEKAPEPCYSPFSLDASACGTPEGKSDAIRSQQPIFDTQKSILANPDARVVFGFKSSTQTLGDYAWCLAGIMNGDSPKFLRLFWEMPEKGDLWAYQQTTVETTRFYGGMRNLVFFDETEGHLREDADIRRTKLHNSDERGNQVWGRCGVAITQMSNCPVAFYSGHKYDSNIAVVSPFDEKELWPIWAFCTSPEFISAVKDLEPKMNVTNATFAKLPFDLAHWQNVAAEKYANGLPEPESDDPTQWPFHGRPEESTAPLHVAVARLLGYRWPAELDDKMRRGKRARALVERCDELAEFADDDGIVCIPSVRGEESAADRLLTLLNAAGVKPAKVRELVGGADLDDWLRNGFFEEHCKLFDDRPFVWHIWDGRKRDGFHALVNYHKLCEGKGKGRKLLESLTYSYLGEWITRQKDGVKRGEGGAEDRLAAALELQKCLEAILAGEPPFDLFVRWKPLSQQPIGWEPDINDGVRMNIRPFLASDLLAGRAGAGVLRCKPNIKWTKDRGKEPERPKAEYPWFWGWDEKTEDFMGGKTFDGNRWNDCHYTNKTKQQAREKLAAKGAENRRSQTP
jgi:hypothetical protein